MTNDTSFFARTTRFYRSPFTASILDSNEPEKNKNRTIYIYHQTVGGCVGGTEARVSGLDALGNQDDPSRRSRDAQVAGATWIQCVPSPPFRVYGHVEAPEPTLSHTNAQFRFFSLFFETGRCVRCWDRSTARCKRRTRPTWIRTASRRSSPEPRSAPFPVGREDGRHVTCYRYYF